MMLMYKMRNLSHQTFAFYTCSLSRFRTFAFYNFPKENAVATVPSRGHHRKEITVPSTTVTVLQLQGYGTVNGLNYRYELV